MVTDTGDSGDGEQIWEGTHSLLVEIQARPFDRSMMANPRGAWRGAGTNHPAILLAVLLRLVVCTITNRDTDICERVNGGVKICWAGTI